jgi:hypothetical protein
MIKLAESGASSGDHYHPLDVRELPGGWTCVESGAPVTMAGSLTDITLALIGMVVASPPWR